MFKVNEGLATEEEAKAFYEAMETGDGKALRRLVEKKPKLLKWETGQASLLHLAAQSYPVATVKYFLSVGFNVNGNPSAEESSPLFCATARGNRIEREEMVRFLV